MVFEVIFNVKTRVFDFFRYPKSVSHYKFFFWCLVGIFLSAFLDFSCKNTQNTYIYTCLGDVFSGLQKVRFSFSPPFKGRINELKPTNSLHIKPFINGARVKIREGLVFGDAAVLGRTLNFSQSRCANLELTVNYSS